MSMISLISASAPRIFWDFTNLASGTLSVFNSGSDAGSGTIDTNLTGAFYIAAPTGTSNSDNPRYSPQLGTRGCLVADYTSIGYRTFHTGQGSASFLDFFNSASAFTIEMVVKWRSGTIPDNVLEGLCGFRSVTAPYYGWDICTASPYNVPYAWNVTWLSGVSQQYLCPAWGNLISDKNNTTVTGSLVEPFDGWNHLIFIYSGGPTVFGTNIGAFAMYRNGFGYSIDRAGGSQNPPGVGSTWPNINNATFYIGSVQFGGSQYYGVPVSCEHMFALVAVYDKVLSIGDITDRYREFIGFIGNTVSGSISPTSGTVMPVTVQLPARNNVTATSSSAGGGVDSRATKTNPGVN